MLKEQNIYTKISFIVLIRKPINHVQLSNDNDNNKKFII